VRFGGDQVGANPVDRAKPGSKLHLAVEGGGLPLSVLVTGAKTNDSLVCEAVLDDLPAVRTPLGRWRCRPEMVQGDKADDHRRCRGCLSGWGIKGRIARCGIESSERLGRHRWKAEGSIAWLAGCRRLRVRYDRSSERFFAFVMLACDRLCCNRLPCPAAPGEGRGAGLGWAEPSAKGSDADGLGRARLGDEGDRAWEHTRRPGAARLGYPTGRGRPVLAARRSRRRWM
jgi:transposase